jgi:hypothetical protein
MTALNDLPDEPAEQVVALHKAADEDRPGEGDQEELVEPTIGEDPPPES